MAHVQGRLHLPVHMRTHAHAEQCECVCLCPCCMCVLRCALCCVRSDSYSSLPSNFFTSAILRAAFMKSSSIT